ncbi:ABC transporter substrate-binding protein [Chelatococcus asaccharovorans]|uniref:ABC transporter substrate-binding protein n=1 Tax=Chelatococcus asaccharovorans TaxID=28210 RepID=UPI00224C6FE9|nr:ABC transporter substrate-binding protein [Chelatococcus asaccharovorans]CAH1657102.1 Peptide/nickel transport system substrate-binding protein [Chelatococcus asaccharovorans]CAH1684891.1 Peptide/nickel transport system substrate-binding protein [Chelatococcus asaccharovorans]
MPPQPIKLMLIACLTVGALATAAVAQEGHTLEIVDRNVVVDLSPSASGAVSRRLGILETLIGIGPDGKLVGVLATSWKPSNDGLVWRLSLRENVVFHDGTPFSAAVAAEALSRGRRVSETLSTLPIVSIEPDGDTTLVIALSEPYGPLPAVLVDYSAAILAPSAYTEDGKVKALVGTGYFRATNIGKDGTIDARRFEKYWGRRPSIETIRYSGVELPETRANMAAAGEAHLAFTLDPQVKRRILSTRRAEILETPVPRTRMAILNFADPILGDLRVRKALSLSVDRTGIANTILRFPAGAATQLLAPAFSGWTARSFVPLAQDVERARALLEEAGWTKGGNGVRVKNGKPLRLEIIAPSSRPEMPPIATALQDQFRAIGVDLVVRVGTNSSLPDAAADGSLQMALVARNYAQTADPVVTLLSDYVAKSAFWGGVNYNNHKLRDAIQTYVRSSDEAALPEIRQEIAGILQDDVPAIPIGWFESIAAASTQLKIGTVTLDPFQLSYNLDRLEWAKND